MKLKHKDSPSALSICILYIYAMRNTILYFLVLLTYFGYSQKTDSISNQHSYYNTLKRIASKDNTIQNVYKTYVCSSSFSGSIDFFYEEDKLIFMYHIYKPHSSAQYITEYYEVLNDSLKVYAELKSDIKYNTKSFKSDKVSKFGSEKLEEILETRYLIDSKNEKLNCYRRSLPEAKSNNWIQTIYTNPEYQLEETDCTENLAEILSKYFQLRKAEKKLIPSKNDPGCLFHLW